MYDLSPGVKAASSHFLCETVKVTFTTWDQEVRDDDKNAFSILSVLFARNTSMFIPDWNGMFAFVFFIKHSNSSRRTTGNTEQSGCLQEDVAVNT